MYGVFKTEVTGEMVWLATTETEDEALQEADAQMLRVEQCVMVIKLESFRQQL